MSSALAELQTGALALIFPAMSVLRELRCRLRVDRFQSRLAHVATKTVPLKKSCSPLLTR